MAVCHLIKLQHILSHVHTWYITANAQAVATIAIILVAIYGGTVLIITHTNLGASKILVSAKDPLTTSLGLLMLMITEH